jgi:hypothetical protein
LPITDTPAKAAEMAEKAREWCGETAWIQATTTGG